MELLVKSDICKEFLDKYNKQIYPELLSRIIEIGILTLKLSFNKLTFTPNELDDIIQSLTEQSRFIKIDFKLQKLKKLKNKKIEHEHMSKIKEKYNDNKITCNDKYYNKLFLNTSNFYDSNYYIPETKSFRNKQLYQKRLNNPQFTTQNKNVYPFWWWNFPDEGQNESYNILNSVEGKQKNCFYNPFISKAQNNIDEYNEEKIFHINNFKNNNHNNI